MSSTARWILVLAAGDGRRLAPLARDDSGQAVPKQFCALDGDRSLLQVTLARAARLVPAARIVTVVARDHRRWWEHELAGWPEENVVVQPDNRGTAAGILLPLRFILERDRQAVVGVLPSDHAVADEAVFTAAIAAAFDAAEQRGGGLVLLGARAERLEADLGWIVPCGPPGASPRRVSSFVEKPPPAEAEDLMQRGALWNTFAFAARARTLLATLRRHLPELARRFDLACPERSDARGRERLYADLPCADFSRSVLAKPSAALRVLAVPACGWVDVGTPERLERTLERSPRRARSPHAAVDLAFALAQRRRDAARSGLRTAPA